MLAKGETTERSPEAPSGAAGRIVLNGVELDFDAGLLRGREGEDVPLRPQCFAVLKHLAANADRVVAKDELLDAVWPGVAVTENSLAQCISEIRRAIGDEKQAMLRTVPRRGYRFVPPADALDPAPAPQAALDERRPYASRAVPAAALLIAAAAVAVLAWLWGEENRGPAPLSIAVLPFDNLSEAADQAYLANGFTDDLTSELARVPGLFVLSRNAALAYSDSTLDPAAIAGRLGVRYLLSGSVRRAGDEVRINAQLTDASNVQQLWAERFEGRFPEVFALQDEVVSRIVTALELRLVPGKANLAVSGDTDDPEAYQAFRRGIEARRAETPQGMVEALGYLRQALALDGNFGGAAAEMAWLYWDADEVRTKALGLSWEEVDARLYESLDIAAKNPSPAYYQLMAELLVRERRSDEAVALLAKAAPLDPSDPWTYEGMAQALIFSGKPVEALGYLDTAMRVDPGWTEWRRYLAGNAAFGQGRYADAVEQLRQIDIGSSNPWPKFYAAHVIAAALGQLDRASDASAAVDRLKGVLAARDMGEPNLLIAQQFFVYKEAADMARLLDGLKKAGVPELPAGSRWRPADRLSGSEISKLVFGHDLSGHQIVPTPATYHATVAADGTATKTIGDAVVTGRMWVQGDSLCNAFPRLLTSCAAVFRNPAGTRAQMNEYVQVFRFKQHEFSVAR